MSNQNSNNVKGRKVKKSAIKQLLRNMPESKKNDATFKEAIITQQFRAKKLVTEAYTGAILTFVDRVVYNDSKTGEISTIMVKYHDESAGGFFSVSLKDLLNKCTVKDGSSVAENVQFDDDDSWTIPLALYIEDAIKEDNELDKAYPIAAYRGYSPMIFKGNQEDVSKKIEAIKKPENLKSNAIPFLKNIVVELNVNKFPI